MTIYQLLRRLVDLAAMPENEQADARQLLGELEDLNAFGTTAKVTETQAHVCAGISLNSPYCHICNRPLRGFHRRY